MGWAWELHRAWPRSDLVIVHDAGHDPGDRNMMQELVLATDGFATLE